MYTYPRLCVVEWKDHHHAAFYPSVDTTVSPESPFNFSPGNISAFVKSYLADPKAYLLPAEHF